MAKLKVKSSVLVETMEDGSIVVSIDHFEKLNIGKIERLQPFIFKEWRRLQAAANQVYKREQRRLAAENESTTEQAA